METADILAFVIGFAAIFIVVIPLMYPVYDTFLTLVKSNIGGDRL